MYLDSPRLYNGVRLIDAPAPQNVLRLDLGALPLIEEINRTGMYLDIGQLQVLESEITSELARLESEIEHIAGRKINPESRNQVAPLIFHELALHPAGGIKLTKTGLESTVDEILCSVQSQHPIVPLILDHRELDKLKTTYTTPLPLQVWDDGRVRTTLSATRARTGRLASSDPNLQNIPVRTEMGRRIRQAFTATPGLGTVLASIDLSQIEMVWAAELADDLIMKDIFQTGSDIHTRTALAMFRLPSSAACCQGKDESHGGGKCPAWNKFKMLYRLVAKTLGFGILYGVTPAGLVLQIAAAGGPSWTVEDTERFIADWYAIYEGIYVWLQEQYARARRYGMVWTAFGRTRYIPEVKSALRGVRNAGLRQAGNTPIQGTAGDHLKLIMAEVLQLVRYYQSFNSTICRIILQVHDELMFELSAGIAEEFCESVVYIMENSVPLSIPVRANYVISDNWKELK